jgi:ubiquinone/menaquinone biosynthesis C-methylase UbiE
MADFRVGYAQNLTFADNTFDAAVMALVISFLSDPGQAVREMARVVRPGGSVSAYMWDVPRGGLQCTRQSIETQVIRISTVYFDFEDFWDSRCH